MTSAHVSILPIVERAQFMAILYGYFDESGKKSDHPVVAIGCVCATQPKLRYFEDAWNSLLRRYELPGFHMAETSRLSRKCGPKMPKGQSAFERMEALKPFADCINEHLEYGLIQALDIKGFNALAKNLRAGLGDPKDPTMSLLCGQCYSLAITHTRKIELASSATTIRKPHGTATGTIAACAGFTAKYRRK
ncbi:MAG: hypothetical protein HY508_12145 [Acidobacteria bacterium]|nr:hypothetical protein [Acidobacteriota bacterium]